METSIFEKYFQSVFLPAIGSDRPVLLIYDGHATHVDLNVIKLAASENITLIKLPPHSSDTLQPLDCSCMKPMKSRWDEALIKWQRLHVGAKLPKKEFARILTEIWDHLNPVILQNGFRKTGIYPSNRDMISKEKFDPVTWSKWEQHKRNIELAVTQKITESDKQVGIPSLFSLTLKVINFQAEMTASHELDDELNSSAANRHLNEATQEIKMCEKQRLRYPNTVEKPFSHYYFAIL